MTKRLRVGLFSMLMLAIALTGCGHFNCASGAQFGASTCTPSAPGIGTTGGGSAAAVFAFAVDTAASSTAGTIDEFTLDTTAQTFQATPGYVAPSIPASDPGAGMVVAQSQFLYAGFGSTDQIFGWSIDSSGILTPVGGSPYAASFMSSVGGNFGTQSIITNPAGTLLFFADTFQDQISVYQIGTGGTLTATSTSPVSLTISPVNMATDGLGRYLYVTQSFSDHTGSEVAVFSIGSDGSLTAVPGSPFSFPMWQVQGEPTGNFLIGTTGNNLAVNGADNNNLYVFSITQSGASAGAITELTPTPTSFSPFSIAVQSNTNGNLMYSFSLNDTFTGFNPIEGYQLSTANGTLIGDTGSSFNNVFDGSWGQFDQSGTFLFVLAGITDPNTNITTFQLGAFDVASDGTLTQPTSPVTLATGGFWAVADPK